MDSVSTTIVIPCYNQSQWLHVAIESALTQTVKCDVIVVNDGSTDKTLEVCKKYPITYVHQENKGLSGARNTGIRCANTEWILPLDADDAIDPQMVEKCLAVEADIVSTAQETFGDYVKRHIFVKNPTFDNFCANNQINCCSLFRKNMWEAIGGYDESMRLGYEDWDFWLRATKAGYKVETIPEYLFFYRKHGPSMISTVVAHHNELKEYMLSKVREK